MAEVVSKANAFSPFNGTTNTVIHEQKHHRQQQHGRISVILRNKSANIYSRSLVLRSSSASSDFYGRKVVIGEANRGISNNTHRKAAAGASAAQVSVGIARAQRWWEKGIKRNMKEVEGPEDLVQSLLAAGDKLVVVDFFSPGCGGCKALHPKICQLAELNPDVQFLQVNYEEHKSMCYALNVHVLPFFRFYRGAHGRLCSFSCTNATIKKFKDALAKHNSDRCSLGAPKGLEEKELAALSANKDLSFTYTAKPEQPMAVPEQEISTAPQVNSYPPLPLPLQPNSASKTVEDTKNENLVSSGK